VLSDPSPVIACADLARMSFAGLPDAPTAILSAALIAASSEVPAHCKVRGNIAP